MTKHGKWAALIGAGMLVAGSIAAAKKPAAGDGAAATQKQSDAKKVTPTDDVFYIYKNRGSRLNHFTPSGWMGDYGDLKLNQGWKKEEMSAKGAKETVDGKQTEAEEDTCMQVKYTAERKQGAGWAGIYWQHPANNWGDKKGGYDLSKYTKLTFWAKGEQGGETIDKFFIGGITGQTEEGDSDTASVSPVTLTKDWKEYEVSLKGLDMSHIIGGFGFAANADANPNGFTMYVDEVRLEK
jgi:hypothetical protein